MKKIFIVGDSVDFIFQVKAISSFRGLKTDSVNNAIEAMQILEKETYKLIIVDYLLPGHNGIELASRIRKGINKNSMIIVMSSRELDEEELSMCDEFNILHYSKPIMPQEFFNRVQGLFT